MSFALPDDCSMSFFAEARRSCFGGFEGLGGPCVRCLVRLLDGVDKILRHAGRYNIG